MSNNQSANRASSAKRPKMTPAEQRIEFERVAREHGTDQDEETFKVVLRKLGKPKTSSR